nr:LysR family transcriptional regulator [Conexibacter arvalis]
MRAFVAVAEELSFTRAAQRLHLAQQALSTQVRQLEERVGAVLVQRTTRKVELTPAGRAFYDHAVALLAAADAAAEAARAAAGERQRLMVGFGTPFDHEPLKPVLERFAQRRPDVATDVLFADLVDACGGARRDDVDIGVAAGPFDTTGLERQVLWSEPLGVAMAADHPLAARAAISVEEYVAATIFDFPTPDQPSRDFWMGVRHRGGRPPHFVARFHSLDALLQGIRAGLGVSFIRERIVDSLGPASGVVFRPLDNGERVEMSLAWRTGDGRDPVRDFVDACRVAFGHTPAPAEDAAGKASGPAPAPAVDAAGPEGTPAAADTAGPTRDPAPAPAGPPAPTGSPTPAVPAPAGSPAPAGPAPAGPPAPAGLPAPAGPPAPTAPGGPERDAAP